MTQSHHVLGAAGATVVSTGVSEASLVEARIVLSPAEVVGIGVIVVDGITGDEAGAAGAPAAPMGEAASEDPSSTPLSLSPSSASSDEPSSSLT